VTGKRKALAVQFQGLATLHEINLAMTHSSDHKEKVAFVSRQKFVMMPATFLDQLNKNKEYAWVFLVLWDEASNANSAQISLSKLVDRCKMNVHTIKDALKWLQESGHVKKIEIIGMPNEYKLSIEGSFANGADTPGLGEPQALGSPRLRGALGTNHSTVTQKTVENDGNAVIARDLEKDLTGVAKLPACCAGAGNTGTSRDIPTESSHPADAGSGQLSLSGSIPKVDGDGVGKESEETPRKGKLLSTLPLPKSLEKYKEKIFEFWRGKQGAKTLRSWKMQMTELEKLQVKYGDDAVDEQLSAAILAGNWHGIRVVNYERYGIDANKKRAATVDMNIHPSYRPLSYD
jgi:hypothetical protein